MNNSMERNTIKTFEEESNTISSTNSNIMNNNNNRQNSKEPRVIIMCGPNAAPYELMSYSV